MKVVVSHPGINPFVKQVCKAFYDKGVLDSFFTTFVSNESSYLQGFAIKFFSVFKYDLKKQLNRRSIDEIPVDKIRSYPYFEIVRTLGSRMGLDARVIDYMFDMSVKYFCNFVNQNIKDADAIYGYEYCCLETFKNAEKLNCRKIYDVPSPEHDFVANILNEEIKKYPELETPYYAYTRKFQKIRTERRHEEWELADLIIANSEFTKESYLNAGLNVEKVKVIPYGCPPVIKNLGNYSRNMDVNFLWAGSFSMRKGAHYLLQAWKKLNPKSAKLKIYGAYLLPKNYIKNLPSNIEFNKTIPQSELFKVYESSDVLIFPTLCDGFGMVISEALSNGLPVITTNKAGGSDLIENGKNGFVIETCDVEALCEIIDWCLMNPRDLYEMRANSLESADKWQWSDYRNNIVQEILNS